MAATAHRVQPLPLRALYTVGELARAVGVSRYMMTRLLRAKGVELLRSGRRLIVPLCEIEEKLPLLWRSVLLAEAARTSI